MQLTYDELKGLVNLTRLDGRKKNAYGICPKCNQDEFGISLNEFHQFGCFRKSKCGFSGNIFTLLAFLGKKISDVMPGFEPRAQLEDKISIADEIKIDLELPDCSMPTGWEQIEYSPYLEQRGFTDTDYTKFNVGATDRHPMFSKGWIIFGIKQAGSIKAYVARNVKSKDEIERLNKNIKESVHKIKRYKNSSSDFAKILYGIEECTSNTNIAYLVEGLFDKQNVDKKLKLDEQEAIKCFCTFKCGVSDEQVFLMQQSSIDTIILLYDPDVIDEIKKAAWKLESYFNVFVAFNDQGADPGDMTKEDFDRVLSNLKSPSQFTLSKVPVLELKKK